MFSRIIMVGVTHRLPAALLLAVVTLIATLGLPRLHIDTGFDSLIPATDPSKRAYERVADEFGSDNRSIIYVRDADLWTPEKLAALERLHYALEGVEFVQRVDDLFTLRSIRGRGDALDSKMLMAEAPKEAADAQRARADALYNPLIVGNYLSGDGTTTALMVSVNDTHRGEDFDHHANVVLEKVIDAARADFEKVFQVGPPRINAELKTSLFEDLLLLGPLSAVLLVVTLLVLMRNWFAALIPLATSLLSVVWAFGFMGWIGTPINILSAMLPSLVVVIGSTEDTHMIAAYLQGLEQSAKERRLDATRFMMRHMGVPLALTILTTSLGFFSNVFSSIGLIRDFAMVSTFAILANGLITLLLVPMVLSRFGPQGEKGQIAGPRNNSPAGGMAGTVERLFDVSKRRHARLIMIATVLLCGFFLYHASKLHVTNDPLSYFRGDRPLIQEINTIHDNLSGMKVFFITLESNQEKAFLTPGNIERLTRIQEFLEKQGIFDRSLSLADHLSLVNREFHGGDERDYKVPLNRDLIAQYLLFFHRQDLEAYVSHDFRRANIVVRHNISDSATLNRHVNELRAVVEHIAGGDMKGYVVGENLMINAAAETLMVAQVKSLAILLAAIFLIMSLMFTSLKGGIISLIPNLIPITLMFGVMGLLDIPLNPGTAMVAVIAIGIAIDGTIHLFSRYNELCRRTSDYEEAVNTTVREEAAPMITTTLALALGFGILLFSNFTVVAQFGALAAATMLFALFANLLITPLIMSHTRLVGLHQILAMTMQQGVLEKSPLLRGMNGYEMRKAILISEIHEFHDGERLVEQGTLGRSMYLILGGQVEVVRRDGDEQRHIVDLKVGDVFGEIGFIRETQRTADVVARGPVSVLRFDFEKIGKDLKFFPTIVAKLNYNISCILGERLAEAMEGKAAPIAQPSGADG